jgi:hypothetical protein
MFNYQDGGFVSLDNSNWVGFTVPILPFKCNCGYYILTFRLTITLWLLYSHLSSYHYFMVIIFSPFVLPLLYGYYILTFRLTITLWLLYSHLSSYHYFMVIIFSHSSYHYFALSTKRGNIMYGENWFSPPNIDVFGFILINISALITYLII